MGVVRAHVAEIVQGEAVTYSRVVVEGAAQALRAIPLALTSSVIRKRDRGIRHELVDICIGGLTDDEVVGLEGFGDYIGVETQEEFVGFISKVRKRIYRESAAFCEGDEEIDVVVDGWDDLRDVALIILDYNGKLLLYGLPLYDLTFCRADWEEEFADRGRLLC